MKLKEVIQRVSGLENTLHEDQRPVATFSPFKLHINQSQQKEISKKKPLGPVTLQELEIGMTTVMFQQIRKERAREAQKQAIRYELLSLIQDQPVTEERGLFNLESDFDIEPASNRTAIRRILSEICLPEESQSAHREQMIAMMYNCAAKDFCIALQQNSEGDSLALYYFDGQSLRKLVGDSGTPQSLDEKQSVMKLVYDFSNQALIEASSFERPDTVLI